MTHMRIIQTRMGVLLGAALVAMTGLFLFMDTAYASTWHIRCPDPVLEGESTTAEAYWHNRPEWERVRVWWHTSALSAEEDVDYRAADNERQTASAHERRVAHMRRGVTTYEETLIEGDETFEFYYIESGGGKIARAAPSPSRITTRA